MSLLDRGFIDRTTGQVRIGDAEREGAVAALGEHYAAGRLTLEEHDERTSRAFSARIAADLWPLFRDLPVQPVPQPPRARESRRRGPGFFPILLVVLTLVALTPLPWPLIFLIGWLAWRQPWSRGHWARAHSHGQGAAHTSGSRRAVRGTCS
jgi:hypothetical protein